MNSSYLTDTPPYFVAPERLYFQATAFAGSLVPLPVNLFELDCSFTLIDGGLTNQVFNGLNNLNWALLDGNAYNTSVPSVFGSLPTLEFLFISDAFISGDLSYMQGMPRMIEHWIDINPGLGGQIPAFIGNIQTLRSFSVTQASLTGALPASLANLDQMIQMWFYANALQGQIPAALGQISTLEILQLEGNSFSGSMPPEICALTTFPGRLGTLGADCPEIAVSSRIPCPTLRNSHIRLTFFPSPSVPYQLLHLLQFAGMQSWSVLGNTAYMSSENEIIPFHIFMLPGREEFSWRNCMSIAFTLPYIINNSFLCTIRIINGYLSSHAPTHIQSSPLVKRTRRRY